MGLLYIYMVNINHSINKANARVVKMVPGYWERRAMEAILIKMSRVPMNLDSGLLPLTV